MIAYNILRFILGYNSYFGRRAPRRKNYNG